MSKQKKKLKDLTIKDNFMFGAVMIDEENCKACLELALEIPIEKVTVCLEKSIIYHPEYKGVRLDVIAKDEKHTHYDVEMQVAVKPALGKRARYYHSQLDMEMLETGGEYRELADAYVIFICDYDPFGRGLYRYTWDVTCREEPDLKLDDGRHTIILSTKGENDGEVPEALVKFLKFVGAGLDESTEDYEDDYVRRLQTSVAHVKISREMEARYMLWRELINEEREEAKEEGRIEGRIQMLIEMLEDLPGDMPEALKARIQQEEDLNVLKEYVRLARKVSAIEEFEELIKDTR
jgi:predicted transposase/invertase (TIGR01784 family)